MQVLVVHMCPLAGALPPQNLSPGVQAALALGVSSGSGSRPAAQAVRSILQSIGSSECLGTEVLVLTPGCLWHTDGRNK